MLGDDRVWATVGQLEGVLGGIDAHIDGVCSVEVVRKTDQCAQGSDGWSGRCVAGQAGCPKKSPRMMGERRVMSATEHLNLGLTLAWIPRGAHGS